MDTIIIGIDWKHYQYFTEDIITAKEKSTKRAILIPGIWVKIRTMIGCSNILNSLLFLFQVVKLLVTFK
jgi:hypothetical protein